MAVTTIQTNNKLIQFTRDINREFVRQNMFSPYMGEGLDAMIRVRNELKSGGEQMNIPLVTKLNGVGKSTGTLAGSEEKIDNYGMRAFVDWLRHAVVTTKSETQKDSADIFGEAKPLLSDFNKEKVRDEILQSFMALPSESAPANIGTDEGQRVNGILFESSTAAQKNTFLADNLDRMLFGQFINNHVSGTVLASFQCAISAISGQRMTATAVQLLKRRALLCTPKIRPYKTDDGYEFYVLFVGAPVFRDAKTDATIFQTNRDARPREGRSMDNNPIFQDGDILYDGVIIRQVPEITTFTINTWAGTVLTHSSGRVEPVFLCGQQAAVVAYGQMVKPTFRKEDDYGFITGVGTEACYGTAKMFKKNAMFLPGGTTLNSAASGNTGGGGLASLVQWGSVTGFYYAPLDT